MIIYIWLLSYNIAVYCAQGAGCLQVSMAHFDYLLGIGAIELIFEMSGIIRIYGKKNGNGDKK